MDITIDEIIRRNLAMRKLPLHFYLPWLVYAKRGLEEMHFNTLQRVKTAVIAIDPVLKTGTLPLGFVSDVMVGLEVGDKVRPIGYDPRLNTRDDEGVAFEESASVYSFASDYLNAELLSQSFFNEYGAYKGRNFGRVQIWTDSYTINRDLGIIRLDNKTDAVAVHLIYLTGPEKVSNKSVIHPFAQAALNAYLDWRVSVYAQAKDQELRRRDFYNEHRLLRAMLNKLTTTEIKRVVRKRVNLAVKN